MTKKSKTLLIGSLILVAQLFIFRDILFPIQWGLIKVSASGCTCPNEDVINGSFYVRYITPDSLKKYDLNYSAIYTTGEWPHTSFDPQGVDLYMIEGEVIGKRRVAEGESWYPVVRIDKWHEVNWLLDVLVKILFVAQLIILYKRYKN
jgi:hypothetical protein